MTLTMAYLYDNRQKQCFLVFIVYHLRQILKLFFPKNVCASITAFDVGVFFLLQFAQCLSPARQMGIERLHITFQTTLKYTVRALINTHMPLSARSAA